MALRFRAGFAGVGDGDLGLCESGSLLAGERAGSCHAKPHFLAENEVFFRLIPSRGADASPRGQRAPLVGVACWFSHGPGTSRPLFRLRSPRGLCSGWRRRVSLGVMWAFCVFPRKRKWPFTGGFPHPATVLPWPFSSGGYRRWSSGAAVLTRWLLRVRSRRPPPAPAQPQRPSPPSSLDQLPGRCMSRLPPRPFGPRLPAWSRMCEASRFLVVPTIGLGARRPLTTRRSMWQARRPSLCSSPPSCPFSSWLRSPPSCAPATCSGRAMIEGFPGGIR